MAGVIRHLAASGAGLACLQEADMSSISSSPTEVIRAQIATANVASPVGVEVMSSQQGRFGATQEAVQTTSSPSDITDALEELGMSVAQRGPNNDASRRKLRKGQGSGLDALSRIADYYDKLPTMPTGDKQRNLLATFRQFQSMMQMNRMLDREGGAAGLPTADDLRKALADFDTDPTHQFVALEDLRARATADGAPVAYLALLDEVRLDFRTPGMEREVLAGLAAARAAHDLGAAIGADPREVRDGYRNLLRESPVLGRMVEEMRKFSSSGDLDRVIDSFLKVAGDDLASLGPSADPVILGDLVRELSNLKTLRTAVQSAEGALTKLDRLHPAPAGHPRPSAEELSGCLLQFSAASMPSAIDADRMIAPFEAQSPEAAIGAINLLRDLHAALPDAVFPTVQAREQQSRILLMLSDRLVAHEETLNG